MKAAKKIELSKEFVSAVHRAINYIASDAMEYVTSNAELVELALDANRLETCGASKKADEELHEMLKNGVDFRKLVKTLVKDHGCNYV